MCKNSFTMRESWQRGLKTWVKLRFGLGSIAENAVVSTNAVDYQTDRLGLRQTCYPKTLVPPTTL